MREGKMRRAIALALAALMTVMLMPAGWSATRTQAATVTESVTGLSEGLKAGTVYGDPNIVTFEVLEDMGFKPSAANIDGVAYTGYVQGSGNPKPNAGSIPTAGAAFKVTAVVDSSVTFVTKSAAKTYHFVEEAGGTDQTGASVPQGALSFEVSAGKTYYFYLDGSKVCVYDIQYSYTKASDYQKETVDVTGGLLAGQTYGKDTLATVEVLEDMTFKTSAASIEGVDYTGYVQGGANPKPNAGSIPTEGAVFKITAAVDSSVTFVTKSASKTYHFVEAAGGTDQTGAAVPQGPLKFDMSAGNTYYFYLDGSKACVFGITLEAGTPDLDWSAVAAPVLATPVVDGAKISVPYTAVIGDSGAEKITVSMYEGDKLVGTQVSKAPGESGTVDFKPGATGTYRFTAKISRSGQEDKESNEVSADFVLPLGVPAIDLVTSKGGGKVEVRFAAVAEADSYEVLYSADGTQYTSGIVTTDTAAVITVPAAGATYSFKVVAKRGDETKESDVVTAEVTAEAQATWGFVTYGNGASASKDKLTGSAAEGSVNIKSESGKIVPASFDGLSFYYTPVPAELNFTLRAKVSVDYWTFSNGQEGFGLMAADKLGGSGWNNCYMAIASKMEYNWDEEKQEVTTDTSASKVTHKIGIGITEKKGVTKDNIGLIEANDTETVQKNFVSTMYPLEQRYPYSGNIVGKYTNSPVDINGNPAEPDSMTIENPITEWYITIQRNNTGYFITYETADGYTLTKKYYDRDILNKIDEDNVYVGFFASRHAQATFSDISFTTIAPEDDAPAEERVPEKVAVNTSVQSPTATGNPSYDFLFTANCDGRISIYDAKDNLLADGVEFAANTSAKPLTTQLASGKNSFKIVFTPDPDYVPGEWMEMVSYDPVEISFSVTYKTIGKPGQSLWVAPEANGSGSKEDPMSIYDAVKYVQPGQTIVIKEGTYLLENTIKVARGINGTADNKIYMVADPDAKTRPVFDFQSKCAGMVLAGDYWYFQGFDVTKSANALKGLQLSGNNCVLDSVNAYYNGSTGIQISRLNTTDEFDQWPANNLVLNCSAYGNADAGYEDADGFAAKLTVGEGNVFDGCIAHHNADDGWDLFAKVQTGSIGKVVIRNSVAYANGFLEDGTNAGNGNGFKLGGDSMSGYHLLENCISYDNKAKGIDSNSCPDIQVKNCTTFNNGSYNVAFYTNNANKTDYCADGIISFRTKNLGTGENIKPKGDQDTSKIYKETNYYWDPSYTGGARAAATGASVNTLGETVSEDWFVSLDTGIVPTRNADGTINMHSVLELTGKAPLTAGARFVNMTASGQITVPESVPTTVPTGDTAPIALYIAIAALAMAALAGAAAAGMIKKRLSR